MSELRAGFEICVNYRDETVGNEWIDKCLRCDHSLDQESAALICCWNTVG